MISIAHQSRPRLGQRGSLDRMEGVARKGTLPALLCGKQRAKRNEDLLPVIEDFGTSSLCTAQ
jgi:hypothetical protein